MAKAELKSLLISMVFPAIFVFAIVLVKLVEILFNISFVDYGIRPLELRGLLGIITSPLLHVDLQHLVANCVPLFILMTGLTYYYKDISYKVFIFIYLITGIMTWLMGREHSVHVGASGIVYALITFHLMSAILRRRKDLMAFSLIVIFLYGSFIWGFFPDFFPERNISWESHLSGAICGVIVALVYKGEGPQRIIHEWDDEEDESEENIEDILTKKSIENS
ncbi:rhomboid family intramembrane serine protease [Bacteroidales bacterium OttesenSCG-928-L14]|nr:rhomboid family intramembrane serine protease [Bacteroidales bacterium OttesenSCG-928-L14]